MASYAPTSAGLLTPIRKWLDDNQVCEILLNKPQEIYVEKNGEIMHFKIPELTEHVLHVFFQLIANENNQELNDKKPLLAASLLDGSRIQIVIPPTAKNYTFAIRRKIVRNLTLQDYRTNFYANTQAFIVEADDFAHLSAADRQLLLFYKNHKWSEFIAQAIRFKKNIVIAGGTSSGKTTFLNACLANIPLNERLIILEDTREIEIPHPNKVQLLASKGQQAIAKITMQDLVQCCLRLRPDRIICGEIRGKEVLDFIAACSTGHEGSFTTIHANNPKIAFMRMMQMYKLNNVPFMTDENIMRELHAVIDIIVQLEKTSYGGPKLQSIYYKYGRN